MIVCVCVSFFRLHRGEEGRVSAPHSPELAGQDRNQEHEDALFAKTNHKAHRAIVQEHVSIGHWAIGVFAGTIRVQFYQYT